MKEKVGTENTYKVFKQIRPKSAPRPKVLQKTKSSEQTRPERDLKQRELEACTGQNRVLKKKGP